MSNLPNLSDPALYINRELSWIEFNSRVLDEALDPTIPLLERIKFLAIFSNNLDEFFMIRVAGLKQQIAAGVNEISNDGKTPSEILDQIHTRLMPLIERQRRCWEQEIVPDLAEHNVHIVSYDHLGTNQQLVFRKYFQQEILPILTPLAVDPGRPFPYISNLSLNLAITLHDDSGYFRFARLKVPLKQHALKRFISVNEVMTRYGAKPTSNAEIFLFIEDVILKNLDLLFPGMTVIEAHPFRVTRDADVEIAEDEASDLLETIERGVRQRRFGQVVRVTCASSMPQTMRQILLQHMDISERDMYEIDGPMGFTDLFQLAGLDIPELKFPSFVPRVPSFLEDETLNIFDAVGQRDILLHHPYDTFTTTVDFIRAAANDPDVVAIKATLYRVGSNSPIVQALLEAREEDKQVAVLVELKARFDEENNIVWARALESQGVHVVYGFPNLKTHAKAALVIRREQNVLRRYVHLSTGNYNATTARIYTDLAFLTCREDIADDVTVLFNRLTGYAPRAHYQKLFVAPEYLRERLTALIDREIAHAEAGKPARIIFKLNSLIDSGMTKRLYRASQAGVKVDLIVRGICGLRPGIVGISENIHVRSIIGRFLEHSRIFWFANDNHPEVYLGSADLMGRNLDRRVETVFPVEDEPLKELLLKEVLLIQLADNTRARVLQSDGTWVRLTPDPDSLPFDCQQWAIENSRHTFVE